MLFNIYTLLFKSLGSVQFLLINFFKEINTFIHLFKLVKSDNEDIYNVTRFYFK